MNFKASNEKGMLAGTLGYKRFTELFIRISLALGGKTYSIFLPA